MVAILLALEGVERKKPNKVGSESSSALTSLKKTCIQKQDKTFWWKWLKLCIELPKQE